MNDKITIKPFIQEPRKSFSKKFRAQIFQDFKGICYKCLKKIMGEFDIEHIKPLSHGGTNDYGNLNIICKPCHKPKTGNDIKSLVKPRRLNNKHSQPKKEAKLRSNAKLQSKGFAKKKKLPIKKL